MRAIVLLLVAASVACTTKPIPVRATQGATILFPIASDYPAFTVGFSSPALGHTDWQFGKTVFRLVPIAGSCTQTLSLVPRWITRAWADPASPAGIADTLGVNDAGSSQVLAVLDIPADACPGYYWWSVDNVLEADVPLPPGAPIQGDLFRTAGAPTAAVGPFEIIAANPPTPATPPEAYIQGFGTFALERQLEELIPYHKILWALVGNEGERAAAGDLVFLFPAAKMSIKTVFEEHGLGRGSIVRWCVAGEPACRADSDPADGMGELRVLFVDPDSRLTTLSIAFDLVDPLATGPVWYADFHSQGFRLAEARLFDAEGVDVTSGFWWGLAGIS